MHPNTFLKTFWQMTVRPEVFVAMSFAPQYRSRFEQVIEPAIASVLIGAVPLRAIRVDNSKTGDSILTDIMDGIAHSQMVLADLSSIGKDSVTGWPYRNGNVMYEVGIALACRQPEDVLLLRDDEDKFLFDVSTVPHMKLDFTNVNEARRKISEHITDRIQTSKMVNDARVEMAVASLSPEEFTVLTDAKCREVFQMESSFRSQVALGRLLDKGTIITAGESKGVPCYRLSELGKAVQAKALAMPAGW